MTSLADNKWSEQKREQNQKLPANKKDYRSGKNILRICLETFPKLLIKLPQKLFINN